MHWGVDGHAPLPSPPNIVTSGCKKKILDGAVQKAKLKASNQYFTNEWVKWGHLKGTNRTNSHNLLCRGINNSVFSNTWLKYYLGGCLQND